MALNPTDPKVVSIEGPTTPVAPAQPAATRALPVAPPSTRDAQADAASLRGITGKSVFRPGSILTRMGPASPAERALPGGSINAAWGRAEEFGDKANEAASRVAANHPDIFGF